LNFYLGVYFQKFEVQQNFEKASRDTNSLKNFLFGGVSEFGGGESAHFDYFEDFKKEKLKFLS